MRWAQRQRLLFIGRTLLETGRVNRSDLMREFGVSTAQASTDLRLYQEQQPGVLAYDATAKAYVRAANGAAK